MEHSDFLDGYRRLCRTFRRPFDQEQAEVWWHEVLYADGRAWLMACHDAVRYSRTFPSLAEMIERAKENTNGHRATLAETVAKPNLPAAQLLLALFGCDGSLAAVDEIVSEWTRDHPEEEALWERMAMAHLRARAE